MSVESELTAVLKPIAPVFPDAVRDGKTLPPLLIYRRTRFEPLNVLSGSAGMSKSTFVIECWAASEPSISAKKSALALAKAVSDAMEADTTLESVRVPVHGEEFEPETLEIMEPIAYAIWHDD